VFPGTLPGSKCLRSWLKPEITNQELIDFDQEDIGFDQKDIG
jgi:hypothetical protein